MDPLQERKPVLRRVWKPFADIFGVSRRAAVATILLLSSILLAAIFYFFHLAPPRSITILTGPEGSMFHTNAMRYKKILLRDAGVNLKLVTTAGSAENL